jgi:serine/threonine protein kinase
MSVNEDDLISRGIASRWCGVKGAHWSVIDQVGRGGTAPVFSINSPYGERALKIYDEKFSSGEARAIGEKRIQQQVELGDHACPYLIKAYEGGLFEGRLFILMNRAPGRELASCLDEIPRIKVREIIDQIAKATIFLREKGLCHRDIKSANIFISDDYEVSTLLDTSVLREINDPVGLGTDHEGQLPVVATTQYTPPEYLFRLIEPSSSLWHALDIYQLGAVMHDLIMRHPLFQEEFALSKENRYRLAWTVATKEPTIDAADVDQDLIFLCRRALDKSFLKRSALKLEDFLADKAARSRHSLQLIGIGLPAESQRLAKPELRLTELLPNLDMSIATYLRQAGVLAHHTTHRETNLKASLVCKWGGAEGLAEFTLKFEIESLARADTLYFEGALSLQSKLNEITRSATLALPLMSDGPNIETIMVQNFSSALGALALKINEAT